MIAKKDINRELLLDLLTKEAYLRVTFTKYTTNTIRVMYCTLKGTLIPTKFSNSIKVTVSSREDPNLLPVWDINNFGWRSFKISNIISVETASESRMGQLTTMLKNKKK